MTYWRFKTEIVWLACERAPVPARLVESRCLDRFTHLIQQAWTQTLLTCVCVRLSHLPPSAFTAYPAFKLHDCVAAVLMPPIHIQSLIRSHLL